MISIVWKLQSKTMPQYSPSAPVNCDVDFNHVQVKGKTAIVTGGNYTAETLTSMKLTVNKVQMVLGRPTFGLLSLLGIYAIKFTPACSNRD